jgi:hypothetical protein
MGVSVPNVISDRGERPYSASATIHTFALARPYFQIRTPFGRRNQAMDHAMGRAGQTTKAVKMRSRGVKKVSTAAIGAPSRSSFAVVLDVEGPAAAASDDAR